MAWLAAIRGWRVALSWHNKPIIHKCIYLTPSYQHHYTYGTQDNRSKLWHHARSRNSTCTDITGGAAARFSTSTKVLVSEGTVSGAIPCFSRLPTRNTRQMKGRHMAMRLPTSRALLPACLGFGSNCIPGLWFLGLGTGPTNACNSTILGHSQPGSAQLRGHKKERQLQAVHWRSNCQLLSVLQSETPSPRLLGTANAQQLLLCGDLMLPC